MSENQATYKLPDYGMHGEIFEKSVPDQHVYHHSASDGPRINVEVEKNTKGFNYKATVIGALTVEDALRFAKDAIAKLQAEFGTTAPA